MPGKQPCLEFPCCTDEIDANLRGCRGPEVESWFGAEDGTDPAVDNVWSNLPFMALSDGAHA